MTKPLAAQYEVKWLQIINKASCCGRVCVCVRARPCTPLPACDPGVGEEFRGRGAANDFSGSVFMFFMDESRQSEDVDHSLQLSPSLRCTRNTTQSLTFKLRVRTDDARLVVPFTSNMGSGFRNTDGSLSSLSSVRSRKGGKGSTH